MIQEIRRWREHVDRGRELAGRPRREVRAQVGGLHHPGPAARDDQAPGAGQAPGQGRCHPVRRGAARLGVPAHDPDRAPGSVRGDPGGECLAQRVVDARVVKPLRDRLADVRRGAAVREEVVVDTGVIHSGEAVLVEPVRQVLGRVKRRRMRRVRPGIERGNQVRTAADQVDLHLRGRQPAAHEQRVVHVHAGEVGRIQVETQPEDDQPGERALGEMHIKLGPRLDLPRGRVERHVPAEHGLQRITRHALHLAAAGLPAPPRAP